MGSAKTGLAGLMFYVTVLWNFTHCIATRIGSQRNLLPTGSFECCTCMCNMLSRCSGEGVIISIIMYIILSDERDTGREKGGGGGGEERRREVE